MTNKSNVSLIALGISEARRGSDITEGGIAHIAEGVAQGWFSPLKWSYGEGDNEMSGMFNLGEFYLPVRKPNGEEDTLAKRAKWLALAECYGIEGELDSKDKMAFQRGFTIAAAMNAGVPVKFETVTVKRGKSDKAQGVRAAVVPASVAFKLVDGEGKPTSVALDAMERVKSNLELEGKPVPAEDVLLERVSALPVRAVGGKHGVFGKVPSASALASDLRSVVAEAGFMPVPKARNTSAKGAKFGEALDYVASCLDLLMGDSGESEFAPSDALNAKLRAVAEKVAAYFANPEFSEVVAEPQGEIAF